MQNLVLFDGTENVFISKLVTTLSKASSAILLSRIQKCFKLGELEKDL